MARYRLLRCEGEQGLTGARAPARTCCPSAPSASLSSSRAPSSLTLQPLLSILNHFTRRPTASQTRVIGALLGKRTEAGEVVISNSFAVPHDEARLFFAESEYKSMLESIRKVSGDKESLVGWSVRGRPV
jgi:hypothetical protein